jgi:hypothetical protein
MAIDFAEVPLLAQPGGSDPALNISRSRHRVTFAVRRATLLCGLSITLVVARHLYGEGGSFSRCKVNIPRRQHFVWVEAVLGEVSEWIVGIPYIGPTGLADSRCGLLLRRFGLPGWLLARSTSRRRHADCRPSEDLLTS